jgi:hypothetical protein
MPCWWKNYDRKWQNGSVSLFSYDRNAPSYA